MWKRRERMGRKTVVTVEYNLDRVLENNYPTLNDGRTMPAGQALREEVPVRTWYKDNFPTDSMGDDIEGCVSWADLLERMRCGESFYDVIGVDDSLLRERCFTHLAELMVVPYDVIYRLWLKK